MTSPALPEIAGPDELRVLHGRPLRPSASLSDTSLFSDDYWSLTAAVVQESGHARALKFTVIGESHRLTMKLLCYGMLSGALPEGEERPAIETLSGHYYHLRYFCNWLDSAHPSLRIADLQEEHLDGFVNHLLTHVRSPTRRHKLRTSVAMLWRYRTSLLGRGLSFDPRLREYWFAEPYPEPGEENATPRIPEHVHGPLLVWAMRFVDDFSEDIIEAATRWRSGRTATARIPWGNARAHITQRIEQALRDGRPLPGEEGVVNKLALARVLGCKTRTLDRYQDEIAEAVERLGVSPYGDLDLSPRGRIDDQQWVPGIALTLGRLDSLASLAGALQTACYIVIAFLSGMRDAEVKHMRAGCVSASRDSHGRAVRWQVRSTAFKSEKNAHGVEATWIVGEPAGRAVTVLENLQAACGSATDLLFAPLPTSGGSGPGSRSGNGALTSGATVDALDLFVEWVDDYCTKYSRPDAIPLHNGRPWHLTTRQFRRTLAWYIARRPGGAIVGAIAYRHHSIQMFEGYAGTSDSGFRAEVEAEEALARGEHLLAMIEQHDHTTLSGPAAEEAYRRLEAMEASGQFIGSVQTDAKRFQRLLSAHGPQIFPGKYVTCVFRPKTARCHAGSDGPDFPTCEPLDCANVALTPENVQVWENEIEVIEADIAQRPELPPLLRSRLEQRQEKIERLLLREALP